VLELIVLLVLLALVAWGARAIIAGMGAPGWLHTVVVVLVLIFAVVLIARAFGVATPSLR
jgi:hypothetical protein